jgi:hypothetical protein
VNVKMLKNALYALVKTPERGFPNPYFAPARTKTSEAFRNSNYFRKSAFISSEREKRAPERRQTQISDVVKSKLICVQPVFFYNN